MSFEQLCRNIAFPAVASFFLMIAFYYLIRVLRTLHAKFEEEFKSRGGNEYTAPETVTVMWKESIYGNCHDLVDTAFLCVTIGLICTVSAVMLRIVMYFIL
jgi:hypothetical protein